GVRDAVRGWWRDIAGRNVANPGAAIASAAMLLRHALGAAKEADAIERAIGETLAAGLRTADLHGGSGAPVSCSEMTDAVLQRLDGPDE
ncbi:MAG: isocitrate/isopropylmalate family dehydrogenase, partial [Acidobacteria bacterium]|nr:isocitrate/isopropylmalate family dehydrogenase [Acidobacteriota bacterium]